MWTSTFWKAVLERAIKTFAQTLAALLIGDGTGLLNSNWVDNLSVAGMAALLSVLTSLGSGFVGPSGPSLASETLSDPVTTQEEKVERRRRNEDGAVYQPWNGLVILIAVFVFINFLILVGVIPAGR